MPFEWYKIVGKLDILPAFLYHANHEISKGKSHRIY